MAAALRLGADEDPLIGQVLAETYRITRLISEGGMGQVFEAAHLRVRQKRVAVKVLSQDGVNDPMFYARFRREAAIAARLSHPNLIEVTDFNVTPDGRPYLAMELLQGEDLQQRLAYRRALPPSEVLEIMKQVGSAAQAAHDAGIVHRDLKPANVFLLDTVDESFRVKVLDFGVAKILGDASRITMTGNVVGTLFYLAPEQFTAHPDEIDQSVDIFALGLITYECLCGARPFPGTTPEALVYQICNREPEPISSRIPGLPAELDAVLARAMAKDKTKRYVRAADFVEALQWALSGVSRPAAAAGDDDETIEDAVAQDESAEQQVTVDMQTIEDPLTQQDSAEQQVTAEVTPAPAEHGARSVLQRLMVTFARVVQPRRGRDLALGLVLGAAIAALVWIVMGRPSTPAKEAPRPQPRLVLERHDAREMRPRVDAEAVEAGRQDAQVQPDGGSEVWQALPVDVPPSFRRAHLRRRPSDVMGAGARTPSSSGQNEEPPREGQPAPRKEPRYDDL